VEGGKDAALPIAPAEGSAGDAVTVAQRRTLVLGGDNILSNEFERNRHIVAGAFCSIMPAGGCNYLPTGSVPAAVTRWLLLQYDSAAGSSARLNFLLVNQFGRHGGMRRLKLAVKNSDPCIADFTELSADKETPRRIAAAKAHPDEPSSKALMLRLSRIFARVGAMVPGSAAARRAKTGDFLSVNRHFGPSVVFSTVNADPRGNPRTTRSSYPSTSNLAFPATDDGFASAIASGGTAVLSGSVVAAGVRADDLRGTGLMTLTVEHYAAAAEGFNADINAHATHLRRLPIEGGYERVLKTTVLGNRPVGIFGRSAAFVSVNEENGSGFSHNHALETAGLPSWGLQVLAGEPRLADELKAFVDALSSSELSASVHAVSLLSKTLGLEPYHGPWADRDAVVGCAETLLPVAIAHGLPRFAPAPMTRHALHTELAAARVQTHDTHSSRCHKGFNSAVMCSQTQGRELRPGDGSAGAEMLVLPGPPAAWAPVVVSAAPIPTSLNPLASDPTVLAVENTRGYPAPGPISRIGVAHEHANAAELAAVLEAAVAEADAVCAAQTEWRRATDGSGGSMDFCDEGAVKSVHDSFNASACAPPDSDAFDAALRRLIRAVNSGGMVPGADLLLLVDSLPVKMRAALLRALLARNTRMTDFNAVITALRGCNTAVYIISSGVAAMVATFYLLEYITKDPTQRENSLSIALAAHEGTLKVRAFRGPAPGTLR